MRIDGVKPVAGENAAKEIERTKGVQAKKPRSVSGGDGYSKSPSHLANPKPTRRELERRAQVASYIERGMSPDNADELVALEARKNPAKDQVRYIELLLIKEGLDPKRAQYMCKLKTQIHANKAKRVELSEADSRELAMLQEGSNKTHSFLFPPDKNKRVRLFELSAIQQGIDPKLAYEIATLDGKKSNTMTPAEHIRSEALFYHQQGMPLDLAQEFASLNFKTDGFGDDTPRFRELSFIIDHFVF